jgi:hypothetical protein
MIAKEQQTQLLALLQEGSKHGSYQMLPPCVASLEEGLPRSSGTSRWDDRRYEWFERAMDLPLADRTVLDIGANIGYFSLRLAGEHSASVLSYEPHAPHARAIAFLRGFCGLDPDRVRIEPRGVGLRDIPSLPKASLIVLLNVLQHAGQDFDADLVPSIAHWRRYAVEYLHALRGRAPRLFFQLGYTWLGSRGKLCKDADIIDFTLSLVTEAGWRVGRCGLIRRLRDRPVYEDCPVSAGSANRALLRGRAAPIRSVWRRFWPQRANRYRFAQRPLWLLEAGGE